MKLLDVFISKLLLKYHITVYTRRSRFSPRHFNVAILRKSRVNTRIRRMHVRSPQIPRV